MGNAHPLTRLLEEVDIAGTYWNKQHGLFKNACPTEGLFDEAEIQRILDTGLLRWPYFSILKEGQLPGVGSFTRTRMVAGRPVGGFADATKVRGHLADGATMSPFHRDAAGHRVATDPLS
ncbi:hypothetical protein [Sphaerisporangium album]|uniref:hypothetical protein n=1 Tax=Sphaerisporangium album TaxID=509200 RepID=UPI0011C07D15|nr:hypothetical protein [Sphaerisporangium album]